MRAAYINNHGDLNQIHIGEIDVPAIGPNDVLIETKFAALNHLDIFVIRGWPGLNLKMPHVMGADGSGIVKEIGAAVTTLKPGDRITVNPGLSCGKCKMCLSGKQVFCQQFSILGENQRGTFAQLFKIPEINALKIPDDYPLDKAAAAPLTFLTAYRMLTTQANLKPGEMVFIHGAGGGVSSAAIQIAKFLGATVIATTSTPQKIEKTKSLGADHIINYKEEKDYAKRVYKELTKQQGIDVVIDNVGQATFQTSLRLLKPGGRLITCGVTSGPFTKIDITNIFWKHLVIKGSTMANQGEFREVMSLIFQKKITPVIDKIFSLEQIKEAESYLEAANQFGKVLLKID
ncbi:MAG: alcohol dehydrogenase [Promethearchaeota archaeon]|nr:MAG: alcohol dehydrogenase [Candidatus Lokiarchaeota archaeon]